jgi:hypothetical protein
LETDRCDRSTRTEGPFPDSTLGTQDPTRSTRIGAFSEINPKQSHFRLRELRSADRPPLNSD